MLNSLATLRARVRFAVRQLAVFSGAGALVMTGASLLLAAGIVWLSARYGVLIGLCSVGGALIVCGLLAFLIGRPKPVAAIAEASPALAEAEMAALPGGELIGQAGHAIRTARAVLPAGSGAAIAGAVGTQLARRPVKAVAAAVALGAVLGLVQATRRTGAATDGER